MNQFLDSHSIDYIDIRDFQESLIKERVLPQLKSVMTELGLVKSSLGGCEPSLFNLPSLCYAAIRDNLSRVMVVEQAWQKLYAAAHLIDAVEDGEELPAGIGNLSIGLNTAVELIFSAEHELAELEDSGLASGCSSDLRKTFHRHLLRMCVGQELSLHQVERSLEETWQIARLKSGAFFCLGSYIGARCSTRSIKVLKGFSKFGEILGLLVQLGDDINDLWGNEKGKSDLAANDWGIPLAYAFSVLPPEKKIELKGLLRSIDEDPRCEEKVRAEIIASGAWVYANLESNRLRIQGERVLCSICPPSPARSVLLTLLARKSVSKAE